MAIPASIEQLVVSAHGVPFTPIRHRAAFTAQEEAAAAHVPGKAWAKTVVCLARRQAAAGPAARALPGERGSPEEADQGDLG